MNSEERVALVTGASSGFGAIIATDLSNHGWRVYGASRSGTVTSEKTIGLRMDVTSDSSVKEAVDQVVKQEGRLHAVISNAGSGIAGALEDTSSEEAFQQFDVNFFGNHRVCRATIPYLRTYGIKHLIVVGSIGGVVALPYQGMYSASKFALEGYCEALRMELWSTGLRISIIEPGDFATGFTGKRVRVGASGTASLHTEAFERALSTIEADERSGENPVLIADTVRTILGSDNPALRYIVARPDQAIAPKTKASISPDDFQARMMDHYKL